jgi:hypothetical protein
MSVRAIGYAVVIPQDGFNVWPMFWQDATDPDCRPNHNGPVWLYFSDVGNNDEGYGHVEVGRFEAIMLIREWTDLSGKEVYPAFWAAMQRPEPPIVYGGPTPPSEPVRALRKRIEELAPMCRV